MHARGSYGQAIISVEQRRIYQAENAERPAATLGRERWGASTAKQQVVYEKITRQSDRSCSYQVAYAIGTLRSHSGGESQGAAILGGLSAQRDNSVGRHGLISAQSLSTSQERGVEA